MPNAHGSPTAETWTTREQPILAAILRRIDAGRSGVDPEDLRVELGIPSRQLDVALSALANADPPFIVYHRSGGWTDDQASGLISDVCERTRVVLRTWPSPDSVLEGLVQALQQAADAESEPEQKGRLRSAAELLGGMARDLSVQAIAGRLGRL